MSGNDKVDIKFHDPWDFYRKGSLEDYLFPSRAGGKELRKPVRQDEEKSAKDKNRDDS